VAGDRRDEGRVGGGAAGGWRIGGDEEVEGSEAQGVGGKVCRGDAGGLSDGEIGVVADGLELFAAAAEEGRVGWIAGVFNGEAQADAGGGFAELG
jgi:hypothetical protein